MCHNLQTEYPHWDPRRQVAQETQSPPQPQGDKGPAGKAKHNLMLHGRHTGRHVYSHSLVLWLMTDDITEDSGN
jgi:hypothetical protein